MLIYINIARGCECHKYQNSMINVLSKNGNEQAGELFCISTYKFECEIDFVLFLCAVIHHVCHIAHFSLYFILANVALYLRQ